MSFQLIEPVLIIGIGSVGSKIASQAKDSLGSDCLVISTDSNDFKENCDSVKISTKSVVNPSMQLIRGSAFETLDEIKAKISNYSSVVMLANLAGKTGTAVGPLVSDICKQQGKSVISFAVMPFKFEKERIFHSGIALNRIKSSSECTIVLDNDALLDSNPDLTPKKCHEISNEAILQVIGSLKTSEISDQMNILSTSKDTQDVEESLKNSLRMLYEDAPPSAIKRSILYVLGGNNVPIGALESITNIAGGIFNTENTSVMSSTDTSEKAKVVMLTSVQGQTHFDKYDPLSIIPKDKTLDWQLPDSSIDCNLELYQLE